MKRALGGAACALAAGFLAVPPPASADPPYFPPPSYASPQAAALGPWPFNFDIGWGLAPVLGGASGRLTSGSNFVVGGGFNLTPRSGLVLEYSDAELGVTGSSLRANGAIDGDADVWGVTLNPVWRFRVDGPIGGYLIGGGGYYGRDVRFAQPVAFTFVNHLGQTVTGTGAQETRQYAGAGGVNVGAGLTWNAMWGMKLFMEVRYHRLFTTGYATQILPVTFGLRW